MHYLKPAKVYITAEFAKRRDAQRLAIELRRLGYNVVSAWHGDIQTSDDVELAMRNLAGIAVADVIVVLGPKITHRVGVDVGYARGCGARVVTAELGQRHLYDALPSEHFKTVEEMLARFKRLAMSRYKKGGNDQEAD